MAVVGRMRSALQYVRAGDPAAGGFTQNECEFLARAFEWVETAIDEELDTLRDEIEQLRIDLAAL